MAEADRVHSTPRINAPIDTTRRRFLAQAAAVAAGGAAVGVPLPVCAKDSQRVQDPILEAIGAHRAATASVQANIAAHAILETDLPKDKRRSNVTVWGEEIVATDDPRWTNSERAVMLAWKTQDDAAVELLHVRPTMLAA